MVKRTDTFSRLPSPVDLERRWIALATLEALLSDDWESRYHSFNRNWDTVNKTRMGSMRNGSGDDVFALFYPDGTVALKGFLHECSALKGQPQLPGVLDGLPKRFAAFAEEPAFDMKAATFCFWNTGEGWARSSNVAEKTRAVDGSGELLSHLVGSSRDYVEFVKQYFEVEIQEDAVSQVFAHEPLTSKLAKRVNPEVDLGALASDLEEIGYPRARSKAGR